MTDAHLNLAGYVAVAGFAATGPDLPTRIVGTDSRSQPDRRISPMVGTAGPRHQRERTGESDNPGRQRTGNQS
jgi:hypothetical protein